MTAASHDTTNKQTQQINSLSLGSMVQNGKFSAGAPLFVNTLKKVDFLVKRERDMRK